MNRTASPDLTVCTCGCGLRTSLTYWHAWQEGRRLGWSESYGRPLWWTRLTFWLNETTYRLLHRKGSSGNGGAA